ncbi:uncharacterized protein LOC100367392 [Saccoglossus kowalevskii]|uniref:Uncharacterized protein LOC100367392 n=1 Tax=Saccoglossus kowalevskii TaxID=10224 RepID=A0ABM0GZG6_SACKO|nr:PREDICTED: uncharacterized protein LOC100367392 [Saccoglossus kowalevskii]
MSTWPSFEELWENYPNYRDWDSNTEIQRLCKLQTDLYGTNTCAIRLSHALIKAGHDLDDLKEGEFNWSGTHNCEGDKYIIGAATMRCYLESRKGPASLISKDQTKYRGKKGIIIFEGTCGLRGATGHVDLWDGNRCAGSEHFNESKYIRLYEF